MIFKNLTFDGISLKEYGVYISGEAVSWGSRLTTRV